MGTDGENQRSKKGELSMKLQNETAVSPVIGVMLMLVVTIIIAAVVSGFAGGLIGGNNQKTPQLAVDARVANGGYWTNSFFMLTVTGVDQAIDTKDLKIVTSWKATSPNGTKITGGKTIVPGQYNYHMYYMVQKYTYPDDWYAVVPLGYGPGINTMNGTSPNNFFWPFEILDTAQCAVSGRCQFEDVNGIALANYSWFGNYKLVAGTTMLAHPFGGAYRSTSTGGSGGSYTVGYGMSATMDPTNLTGGNKYYYTYGNSYNPHSGTNLGGAPSATFNPVIGLTPGSESMDMMMGVLGPNWNYLRAGDTVNIKIVHTPSGKIIVNKDVAVEG